MMKGPFMDISYGTIGEMNDPRPVEDNEFAEYMWMGEELDEFDQQVEQQLMEEFLIETCVEQMLRDEDEMENIPPELQMCINPQMSQGGGAFNGLAEGGEQQRTSRNREPNDDSLASQMAQMNLSNQAKPSVDVTRSRLNPNAPIFNFNPNAKVFVPRCSQPAPREAEPAATPPTASAEPDKPNADSPTAAAKVESLPSDADPSTIDDAADTAAAAKSSSNEKLESAPVADAADDAAVKSAPREEAVSVASSST